MVELNIYEIIMQMINFVILLYLLKKILYKPMLKFLSDREKGIKDTLDKVKKDQSSAEEYLKKQEAELEKAKKDALQLRYDAEHSGKREREKIIAEAGQQTEKMLRQAREDIEAEVNRVKKDIKNEIAAVSIKIAEKLIEKNIDAKEQASIITDSIEQIK